MPEQDPEKFTFKDFCYIAGVLIATIGCVVIPLNLIALIFGLEFHFWWAMALAGFIFLVAIISVYRED